MNTSRNILFGSQDYIHLKNQITSLIPDQNNLFKCRILYDKEIHSIEIQPYLIRSIQNVKIIHTGHVSYNHKYVERHALDIYRQKYPSYDEVIFIRKGKITDAYYYNIVVETHDNQLLTPDTPLLKGTKRASLLRKNIIQIRPLKETDLYNAKYIHLINAMTELGEIRLIPSQLTP